jgi:hypothetical protein
MWGCDGLNLGGPSWRSRCGGGLEPGPQVGSAIGTGLSMRGSTVIRAR